MVKQRNVMTLPAKVPLARRLALAVAGLSALVAGGLASCDSTAKFTVVDTQFADLQVVTAFPARVDDNGTLVRVCGEVMGDDEALEPNGVELTVAMMSNGLKKTACKNPGGTPDRDRSIKDGDLIDLTRINNKQALGPVTVAPQHFTMRLDCAEPHKPGNKGESCDTGVSKVDLPGIAVRYQKLADRCNPKEPSTWVNVGVLLDHTGSVSGLVDGNTQLEDEPGKLEPILPITAQAQSDPFNQRLSAVDNFLSLLNDNDRAGVWYFDEKVGVDVGCSDAYVCAGGAKDKEKCNMLGKNDDCPGGACEDDQTLDKDKFGPMSFAGPGENRQNQCFGKLDHAFRRDWFRNGLLSKAKHAGEGRAPLWHAANEVFEFMSGAAADGNAGVGGAKHIVILTDGPDTCTDSENFNYRDLTAKAGNGQCRTKCAQAETDYIAFRDAMIAKKWPVVLHFVHFQSPAGRYRVPDARMQELACRSGGTYQFINTEEVNKSDPNAYAVVTTAMSRVRSVLAGSWRVGFKHTELKPSGEGLPVGKMMSLNGFMQFKNTARFPSLNAVYTDSQAWRFGFNGLEDHRLLYRSACVEDKDCGGSDECGTNRCLPSGLCASSPAEDHHTCSKGKCCAGKCESSCKQPCK